MMFCMFCCASDECLSDEEEAAHIENFGQGCPHRTEPCDSPDCKNGDHSCVTPSLSHIGCDGCRQTGYCPKCKGSGDKKPMPHHRKEYEREARKQKRLRAPA